VKDLRCLLLHGLGGSPFEVRPVADALIEAGHATVCPVLPGHAATESDYLSSSYSQWLQCARAAYAAQCNLGPVLLGGYSLGGLLALDLALEAAKGLAPQPMGLLLLATPLFLWRPLPFFAADWRIPLLPVWNRLQPVRRVPCRSAASRTVAPGKGTKPCVRTAICARCNWRNSVSGPGLAGSPRLCASFSCRATAYARRLMPFIWPGTAARVRWGCISCG